MRAKILDYAMKYAGFYVILCGEIAESCELCGEIAESCELCGKIMKYAEKLKMRNVRKVAKYGENCKICDLYERFQNMRGFM